MKKVFILSVLFILLCFSCKKETKIYDAETEYKAQQMVDSMVNDVKKSSILDSTGMKNSPVVILKSRFVTQEYSNYKDIELKYKNISDKTIQAIRFEWYGENSFGEPADMGISNGEGGGFTDETLKPGKIGYGTWSILSSDGKTIKMARAYEVVFSDGTKWKLKK